MKKAFTSANALTLIFLGAVYFVPVRLSAQWNSQTSGTTTDLFGLHFPTSSEGWAVGAGGAIYHSSDGGVSWSSQTSNTIRVRDAVFFTDANNGFAVGDRMVISSTTDAGVNWSGVQITGYGGIPMHDVHFPSSSTGYISAQNGTVLKTTNSGGSWQDVSVPSVATRYRGVHFVDANTGWVVGEGGNIVHTSNGGSNWTNQASQSGTQLHGIDFINATTGWVVGNPGIIKKTTNGGTTWSAQTSGVSSLIKAVDFIDANTGWAVGANGLILFTDDGGSTWQQQTSGVTATLHDVQAFSTQEVIIVGTGGTVLKTTNGGMALPVELVSFEAIAKDNRTIALNWQTATEQNNEGFEIQWSTDGKGWEKIGFVPGHGNASTVKDYTFEHDFPAGGHNYYRLKQMDHDGAFDFSPVKSISLNIRQSTIRVYPNPIHGGKLTVEFGGNEAGASAFRLLSSDGRVIESGQLESDYQQIISIDMQNISAGIYFLTIQRAGMIFEERIMVK